MRHQDQSLSHSGFLLEQLHLLKVLDISGIKRLQFDVLVIGAGGAGLSAAIAASQEKILE